jgi:hypothetical protein
MTFASAPRSGYFDLAPEFAARLCRVAEGFISGPVKDLVDLTREHVGPKAARAVAWLFITTAVLGSLYLLAWLVAAGYGFAKPVIAFIFGASTAPAPPVASMPDPYEWRLGGITVIAIILYLMVMAFFEFRRSYRLEARHRAEHQMLIESLRARKKED